MIALVGHGSTAGREGNALAGGVEDEGRLVVEDLKAEGRADAVEAQQLHLQALI